MIRRLSTPRDTERGFTLVELMVVIVIIGLAAAAVVLAWPDEGGSLRGEAARLAARAKAARDTAILEARPVTLTIGAGGYEVARRIGGEWRVEGRYEWTERTRPEESVRIGFDPTGLAEPARVVLRRGERRAAVTVGAGGEIRLE